eukprot:1160874-Pelagomonas_calceolata.AAC.14
MFPHWQSAPAAKILECCKMSIACVGCTLLLHSKTSRYTIAYTLNKLLFKHPSAAAAAADPPHHEGFSGSFPHIPTV